MSRHRRATTPPEREPRSRARSAGPAPAGRRRRQRSARLTTAAALLVVAAAGVLAALPTDSTALLSLAAASSVGLGAAATRITHAEVLTTRRDAAADRAERAQEHRVLTERAQARHRAREADLGDRVREARNTVAVLRVRLAEVEGRAAEDAERIALLEAELDAARTELLTSRDELAARRAAGGMPVWVAPHG